MRLTLGHNEIAQLQKTIETILTPTATASPEAWGQAVMKDVSALLRADQALFALPVDISVHVSGDGERTSDAARAYEAEYWGCDFILGSRRKQLGLEVHHQDQLYRPGETRHDVLFNEWCVPHKLFDTLGMAVDIPDALIPAGVNVYHDRRSGTSFGQRGQALMTLLLPAFKASINSYSSLVKLRDSLSDLIDRMRDGACLVSESGQIIYENRSLQHFLEQDVEPELLRSAINAAALTLLLRSPSIDRSGVFQCVQTPSNVYEVRASRLNDSASSSGVTGVVIVEGLSSGEMLRRNAAHVIQREFRLTHREVEVAVLLANRLSTNAIAKSLGISPHTARHHTEKVLEKTGVSSRALIASLFDRHAAPS